MSFQFESTQKVPEEVILEIGMAIKKNFALRMSGYGRLEIDLANMLEIDLDLAVKQIATENSKER